MLILLFIIVTILLEEKQQRRVFFVLVLNSCHTLGTSIKVPVPRTVAYRHKKKRKKRCAWCISPVEALKAAWKPTVKWCFSVCFLSIRLLCLLLLNHIYSFSFNDRKAVLFYKTDSSVIDARARARACVCVCVCVCDPHCSCGECDKRLMFSNIVEKRIGVKFLYV